MRSLMLPFAVAAGLAGCATRPAPPPAPAGATQAPPPAVQPADVAQRPQLPHYRCDGAPSFDARFGDDSVQLLFPDREPETLLRDAGGTSPRQTVYSSTKLKAEFGLDPDGRGAKLNVVSPPVEAHCMRD
jgi:hypothetical protein